MHTDRSRRARNVSPGLGAVNQWNPRPQKNQRKKPRMSLFEQIIVAVNTFIGPGIHGLSSASSNAALFLGLF